MEEKVAALAFRKSIRNTGKTQENMTSALWSSSPESFALSVPTAAPVGFLIPYCSFPSSAVNRRFPGFSAQGLRVGERKDRLFHRSEAILSLKLGTWAI